MAYNKPKSIEDMELGPDDGNSPITELYNPRDDDDFDDGVDEEDDGVDDDSEDGLGSDSEDFDDKDFVDDKNKNPNSGGIASMFA